MGSVFLDDMYEKIIEKAVELELKKDSKRFWNKKQMVEYLVRGFLSQENNSELKDFVTGVFLDEK